LAGGIYSQAHELKTSMPRGTWTRITLDVDLTKGTIGLSVGGSRVIDGEPLHYPPAGRASAPRIDVGTLTDNLTGKPSACKVHIDDVTFDVEP
jgi:hypothetical protein